MDTYDSNGNIVPEKRSVTAVNNAPVANSAPAVPTTTATESVMPSQPQDSDIKQMLSDVKGGTGITGPTIPGQTGQQTPAPQVDIKICKSIIRIIYRLPQVMLGFKYDFDDAIINERAELLVSVMNQYGMGQVKHLNAIFLAIGVGQDMIEMFAAYRQFKKEENIEKEAKAKEDELRAIELEKKKAESLEELNRKLDKAQAIKSKQLDELNNEIKSEV